MAKTILVAVKDLLFGSKLQEAGKRSGVALSWAPRFEQLSLVAAARRPDVLIADLGEPGVLAELGAIRAARPDVRIIGFVGHVHEEVAAEARRLGLAEVLTKGQLAAQVDRILLRENGD